MFPMDRSPQKVTIEYDSRGTRVTKEFRDAYASRRFYTAMHKAERNPKVIKAT